MECVPDQGQVRRPEEPAARRGEKREEHQLPEVADQQVAPETHPGYEVPGDHHCGRGQPVDQHPADRDRHHGQQVRHGQAESDRGQRQPRGLEEVDHRERQEQAIAQAVDEQGSGELIPAGQVRQTEPVPDPGRRGSILMNRHSLYRLLPIFASCYTRIMDIDAAFDDAALLTSAAAMRALGHPIRLGIMRRLAAEPETCACDFTEVFGVAQPTISQHLKVLRETGLVRTRRRGTQICYSVDPLGLAVVTQAIATLTRHPSPPPADPTPTLPASSTPASHAGVV